ncbi:hypothetical protein [Rhodococcus sp. X156]|uniref:hypothetical protein n=1 Tax=Rhodococcus sp. X156 TaxID=2499145 RepID=UPI000FDADACC|nr:hypothetical protein [Rhodococcus sp. X156]
MSDDHLTHPEDPDQPAPPGESGPPQDSVVVHRWLLAGLIAVAAVATIVVVVLVVGLMGDDSDPRPQSDDRPTATALPSTRSPTTTTEPAEASTGVEEPTPSASAAAPSATAVRTSTTRTAVPSAAPSTQAPSTTTLAPAPTGPPGVGTTVSFTVAAPGAEDIAGTVTLNGTRRISEPENDFGDDPASGSYLVATFTVSVSAGSTYVSDYDFRAEVADGTTRTPSIGVVNQQMDGTVDAGRQLIGDVAFDLPPGGPVLIYFYGPKPAPLASFRVTG